MVGDILDGITHIGIWPGMSREYRPTDWKVGFMHVPSGRRNQLVRVRNEDRDKVHASYLSLRGDDYALSVPYIERADGAKWTGCAQREGST